jgi:predicted RNA-binding Zn-ribbon protein involved in translation (DUF1610 family)
MDDDDRTPVCGESYEHDLMEIDARDGLTTYECRECGAEIITDDSC